MSSTNYIQQLGACSNFHLLLTTRIKDFDGVAFFPVSGLKEEFAVQLFKKYYPDLEESEEDLLHIDRYEQALQFIRYAEAVIVAFVRPTFELTRLSQNIGSFHKNTGDLNKAMESYLQMESLSHQLLAQEANNADFKNGLAISYFKLGQLHQKKKDVQLARSYFQQAEVHWAVLAEQFPAYVQFGRYLEIVSEILDDL